MTAHIGTPRIFRPFVVSLVCLAASGCVVWVNKPGFDQAQYLRDRSQCERYSGTTAFSTPWLHCMEALGYGTSYRGPTAAARAAVPPPAPAPPMATPFERLTEARRHWTRQLLEKIDGGECVRLTPCWADYEETVRRIAGNVSYTVTSGDELLFRAEIVEVARGTLPRYEMKAKRIHHRVTESTEKGRKAP